MRQDGGILLEKILKSKTATYKPGSNLPMWYQAGWGGFTLGYVQQMTQDDAVKMGLRMRMAPLHSATFEIRCPYPKVKKYVADNLERFWRKSLGVACRDLAWGYSAAEPLFRLKNGRVQFDALKALHPLDCKPWTKEGRLSHVVVRGVTEPLEPAYQPDESEEDPDEDRKNPHLPTVAWFVHEADYHPWYGLSALLPAWKFWRLKQMPDGCVELWFKFLYKFGFTGMTVRAPEHIYSDTPGGPEISAKDYAQQMTEWIKAGGNIILPDAKDESGDYLWKIEKYAEAAPGNSGEALERGIELLDKHIFHSLEIPDEIITHEGNVGGYSRSQVALTAFFLLAEEGLNIRLEAFDDQILRPLVRFNYGQKAAASYTIKPMSLVPKEQQQGQGQPGQPGQEEQQPGDEAAQPGKPVSANVPAKPPGANGRGGNPLEALLGGKAKGKGNGKAQEMSQADEGEGTWVTIGAKEGEDGERHGGTAVFVKNGKITKGPEALKGRSIHDIPGTGNKAARDTGVSEAAGAAVQAAGTAGAHAAAERRSERWDGEDTFPPEVRDKIAAAIDALPDKARKYVQGGGVHIKYLAKSAVEDMPPALRGMIAGAKAFCWNHGRIECPEGSDIDGETLSHELTHHLWYSLPQTLIDECKDYAANIGEKIVRFANRRTPPEGSTLSDDTLKFARRKINQAKKANDKRFSLELDLMVPPYEYEYIAEELKLPVRDAQYLTIAVHSYLAKKGNYSLPDEYAAEELVAYRAGTDRAFAERVFDYTYTPPEGTAEYVRPTMNRHRTHWSLERPKGWSIPREDHEAFPLLGHYFDKWEEAKKVADDVNRKKTSAPAQEMSQGAREFSSTQFNLEEAGYSRSQGTPVAALRKLQESIADEDLTDKGRTSALHITIRYGLHTPNASEVAAVVDGFGPVRVKLGPVTVFPAGEESQYDVLKVDIIGADIRRLNRLLGDSLDHTDTFDTYRPHCTLAYVKLGLGRKYAGRHAAQGYEVSFDSLEFSPAVEDFVTTISLTGGAHKELSAFDPTKHPRGEKGSEHGGEFVSKGEHTDAIAELKRVHPFPDSPPPVLPPGAGRPDLIAKDPALAAAVKARNEHTAAYHRAYTAETIDRLLHQKPPRPLPLPSASATRGQLVNRAKLALERVNEAASDVTALTAPWLASYHAAVTASHPEGQRALEAARAEAARRLEAARQNALAHVEALPEDLREAARKALDRSQELSAWNPSLHPRGGDNPGWFASAPAGPSAVAQTVKVNARTGPSESVPTAAEWELDMDEPQPSGDTSGILASLERAPVMDRRQLQGRGRNEVHILMLEDATTAVFKPARGEKKYRLKDGSDVDVRRGVPTGTGYRREVATYRVARVLGMEDLVPPTSFRDESGDGPGSAQQFVTGTKTPAQVPEGEDFDGPEDAARAAVLDYICCASDRHEGNWLLRDGKKLTLIDNSATFPDVHAKEDFVDMRFWVNALDQKLDLPDLSGIAGKWAEVERELRSCGLGEQAIALTRERFEAVTSGQYRKIRDLPSPAEPWMSIRHLVTLQDRSLAPELYRDTPSQEMSTSGKHGVTAGGHLG